MTDDELDARYTRHLRPPAPVAAGVCQICHTFTDPAVAACAVCRSRRSWLHLVVPVTYSVGGGVVHHQLRGYKDDPSRGVRDHHTRALAAILSRFLREHERCVAVAAGAAAFDLVTTVPSATPARDRRRGRLRGMVARYQRLLYPTGANGYQASRRLDGAEVLLIDDTWTTGASAQAAAQALRRAGARRVALVVIARHVNPGFGDNGARLRALPPFQWSACAVECAGSATVKRAPSPRTLETVAAPSIACASSATIARPRPEPSPRPCGERSCR